MVRNGSVQSEPEDQDKEGSQQPATEGLQGLVHVYVTAEQHLLLLQK